MYGYPLLLGNLPPTDSASLADYLPYLNLLWELLREQADQILPHSSEGPVTISVKPWLGSCSPKGSLTLSTGRGPHLIILTMPTAVKLNGIPQ
jgi:hypothetical protein